MNKYSLLMKAAHPLVLHSSIIEAELDGVEIGELCEIRASIYNMTTIAHAQVLGFKHRNTILSLLGEAKGLSRECVIYPTGAGITINLGDYLRGCVVNPQGKVIERLNSTLPMINTESRPIQGIAPDWQRRKPINQPLFTKIKALDSLITCGVGQRIGIFASAGCGKTSLIHALIKGVQADVYVIGLVGERGREVAEFMDTLRKSERKQDCVLVFATSDYSSIDRCNAVLVATTIAEYFRDCGKNVVLFLDSITRYARALRDLALASGEAPARRGYPASVFENLPRVLERAGRLNHGSITAFYTVLLESDDETDPVANEIRSILDGHIYLSPELAAQNHYPAIDVLKSLSRVASQVCHPEHLRDAAAIREKLVKIEKLKFLIEIGEYHFGENSENDLIIGQRDQLQKWLCQTSLKNTEYPELRHEINELAS